MRVLSLLTEPHKKTARQVHASTKHYRPQKELLEKEQLCCVLGERNSKLQALVKLAQAHCGLIENPRNLIMSHNFDLSSLLNKKYFSHNPLCSNTRHNKLYTKLILVQCVAIFQVFAALWATQFNKRSFVVKQWFTRSFSKIVQLYSNFLTYVLRASTDDKVLCNLRSVESTRT